MSKNMTATDILNAVDDLESALSKVGNFKPDDIEFSERVLDNRIITLEGYLRFLKKEGIPRLKSVLKEGEKID